MQNKLQELTEKIYQEGISRGNAEAEEIVSNARKEAENIISEAKKDADKLVKEAKKKSEEIISNGKAELKLSSKQLLNSLKQQITDVINGEIIHSSVSAAFDDRQFIQKIIELSVKNWHAGSDQSSDITVLIPEKDEKKLTEYFEKSVKDLLDKGLEIKADGNIKSGFQISPKDGSYKISFTGDDFINFFKQYLRPRLVELLFEDKS
jgi:V/A-type H+-transporting ATPase subunit E